MGCRNARSSQTAREKIVSTTGSKTVSIIGLDLARIKHVEKFVQNFKEKFSHVDVIINNGAAVSDDEEETVEGVNTMQATNYLGPLHLTQGLLPVLSEDGIVVTMTGSQHSNAIVDNQGYAQSKKVLAIVMTELARRVSSTRPGILFYSVDPGYTWSGLHTAWSTWLAGPALGASLASTAATTPVWLAGGGGRGENSGRGELWNDCEINEDSMKEEDNHQELWQSSRDLIHRILHS